MSLVQLNDDLLRHIIYYTNETISDKINQLQTHQDIEEAIKLLEQKRQKLTRSLSASINRGSVYRMTYILNNIEIFGYVLIQNERLITGSPTIMAINVIPSNNKRIFGYYEIIEPSFYLTPSSILTYKCLYKPPIINPKKLKVGDIIGMMTDKPYTFCWCPSVAVFHNAYREGVITKINLSSIVFASHQDGTDTILKCSNAQINNKVYIIRKLKD
jgi:hypothetical protein